MLNDFFVTKIGMTQAWTKAGKRLAITRCAINPNIVVSSRKLDVVDNQALTRQLKPVTIFEIGYGKKKLKNMSKPLRSKLEKGGFSLGVANLKGVRFEGAVDSAESGANEAPKVGESIAVSQVLSVGDVVQVQGITKGRGFAGGVKRYGFKGGPRTHGQSDRERAVGSIGAGTTPGRVFKGKRMPGHYGTDTKTVLGLVVVYIDEENGELWLSGPVPGALNSQVRVRKTGKSKEVVLDTTASGIKATVQPQEKKVEVAEADSKQTSVAEEVSSDDAEESEAESAENQSAKEPEEESQNQDSK